MHKRFCWALVLLALLALLAAACRERSSSPAGHPITGVEDLTPGMKVGVQRGTTGAFYAQDTLAPKGIEVVTFVRAPDMFNALEAGQIQAVVGDLPVSADVAAQKPALAVVQQIPSGEEFAFAVDKENPALLDALNQALGNLFADGTYAAIFARYFPGQRPPAHEATARPFAGCPVVKTQAPRTLTVGVDFPFPPFESFTAGGAATGFDVDLVTAIAGQLCLEPRWVDAKFDTIFTSLSAGKLDMVASAVTAYAPPGSPAYATVEARRKIVSFTRPYYASLQALTVKRGG